MVAVGLGGLMGKLDGRSGSCDARGVERVRSVRSASRPPLRFSSEAAPQHRRLGPQRVVGNRAVAAALGHRVLQRQIAVRTTSGIDAYTWDDARDFRRSLMLELKNSGYRDVGTKGMWGWVDDTLREEGVLEFKDWAHLIDTLVKKELLDRPLRSGIRIGPKRLGMRPAWNRETRQHIQARRQDQEGLAARHVIASSTLGLGIERSTASFAQMTSWLVARGHTSPRSTEQARREIWIVVHNHAGNLWLGSAPANTAIGFIRSTLETIKARIPGAGRDPVDLAMVQAPVEKAMVDGQDYP